MVYFREVQRLWAWVALLAAISVPMVALTTALPQAVGNHPAPRGLHYALLGLPALLAIWFSLGSLVTEVRDTGLSIHFHLLWAERAIPWSEIHSAEAITYSASGWGVRWGAGGMTYNVSGNRGVRVELAGGERVMVGSQRAFELAEAIAQRVAAAKRGYTLQE